MGKDENLRKLKCFLCAEELRGLRGGVVGGEGRKARESPHTSLAIHGFISDTRRRSRSAVKRSG